MGAFSSVSHLKHGFFSQNVLDFFLIKDACVLLFFQCATLICFNFFVAYQIKFLKYVYFVFDIMGLC